jgi:hypothetical protein
MNRQLARGAAIFLLLVAYGAASRLISVVPNFHAVAAAALLAGCCFRSRALAALVPLSTLLATDLVIGTHAPLVMAAVYACLVLPVFLGRLTVGRWWALRVGGAALLSSCVFFLATNLAHWYCFYPLTWTGLARCYTVAVPFFGYTLAGDLMYSAALFAAYAAASGWRVAVPERTLSVGGDSRRRFVANRETSATGVASYSLEITVL